MFKAIATSAVVSKGFNDSPALKFSENGESVRFRIGQKVYDSRAEGNHRWMNLSVKAFGDVCERIRKMKLKEGSFVNLTGRLDEEKWTDQETGKERSANVLILEDIEYASAAKGSDSQGQPQGNGQPQGQGQPRGQNQPQGQQAGPYQQPAGMMPPYQGQPQGPVQPQGQGRPQGPVQPQAHQAVTYGQAQPAGMMPPPNQMPYNGFSGYEAYGGNNLF